MSPGHNNNYRRPGRNRETVGAIAMNLNLPLVVAALESPSRLVAKVIRDASQELETLAAFRITA